MCESALAVALLILAYYTFQRLSLSTNLPACGDIGSCLAEWFTSGNLREDAIRSCVRVSIGMALGSFAGVLTAICFYSFRRLSSVGAPMLDFLRVVSPLAWIPIAILLFGIGDRPAIALVSLASYFSVSSGSLVALRNVSASSVEVARLFEASPLQLFRYVYLPQVFPAIISAIRVSFGISWYVLVAAEMMGAQSGLGYAVQLNKLSLQTNCVMAAIVVIGCIGTLLGLVLDEIEMRTHRAFGARERCSR
jgi:ABC-type nitrate/sulfonate/bicarbonate transport system permease component